MALGIEQELALLARSGLPPLEDFLAATLEPANSFINFSTVFAGHAVGIKEVQDGIWLGRRDDEFRFKMGARTAFPAPGYSA